MGICHLCTLMNLEKTFHTMTCSFKILIQKEETQSKEDIGRQSQYFILWCPNMFELQEKVWNYLKEMKTLREKKRKQFRKNGIPQRMNISM